MLSKLVKLDGVLTLSKQDLQSINGGGCWYYDSDNDARMYAGSSANAQSLLRASGDHWCCASCGSATWMNTPIQTLWDYTMRDE